MGTPPPRVRGSSSTQKTRSRTPSRAPSKAPSNDPPASQTPGPSKARPASQSKTRTRSQSRGASGTSGVTAVTTPKTQTRGRSKTITAVKAPAPVPAPARKSPEFFIVHRLTLTLHSSASGLKCSSPGFNTRPGSPCCCTWCAHAGSACHVHCDS